MDRLIIAALAGCNEKRHPLLKEAADIIHQRPDSALALISRVDTASMSETERMEYCLLRVMTDYIVLHHADSDSPANENHVICSLSIPDLRSPTRSLSPSRSI